MAEVPAEVPAPGTPVLAESPALPGSDFLKGVLGMPAVRQMTLLVALAGSVALAIFATLWMQAPDYRPVSTTLSPQTTNDVVTALDTHQIDYKLDQRNGMVLVPDDQYYTAKMALAGEEVLSGQQLGYELLDEDQGFGVSQFMESARHRRSVEGELARSIATITAVSSARVLLATPKTSTFLRDRRKPTASVTVSLKSGRQLNADQVRGITNLVAGAVPELKAQDVVVIDQLGNFLSDGILDAVSLRGERNLQLERSIEADLHQKVANILTPWIGSGRFTAEVNATLDFTRSEQTEESFDPELSAIRSEQLYEAQNVDAEETVGGVPGTLSNQPPEFGEGTEIDTDSPNREKSSSTVRATKNYEVDRTITHTQHQSSTLTRLSVTVVVDDHESVDGESGEVTHTPWTEDELDKLNQAVRTAIGFDEERGDSVSIVNRAFYRAPQIEAEPTPFWAQGWFADVIKQVLGGIAILVVVLGLLRPMYKNLSQAGELVREHQSLAIADMTQIREAALQEAVPGLPMPIQTDTQESGATKMETVRNLIAEDPDRVAQVVKHWVNEDE